MIQPSPPAVLEYSPEYEGLSVRVLMVREKGERPTRKITSSRDAFELLKGMARLDREHFVVLHLDVKGTCLGIETVSIGTVSASLVHPREVLKGCILSNSAKFMVAHNHPSGDPEPSDEDIAVTKRLADAGQLVGIPLIDHIIIGGDAFVSLKQRGIVGPV